MNLYRVIAWLERHEHLISLLLAAASGAAVGATIAWLYFSL